MARSKLNVIPRRPQKLTNKWDGAKCPAQGKKMIRVYLVDRLVAIALSGRDGLPCRPKFIFYRRRREIFAANASSTGADPSISDGHSLFSAALSKR
jgi:hypothetical protein